MRTIRFYKEPDSKWFADIPEWEGEKWELEMVMGADMMLDILSQGEGEINLTLSEKEFSDTLKECFLSVWVDDDSAFGTFPLESMACGIPVIGNIPNMQPDWMTDENGIWVTDKTLLPDYVADFIQNWLEDNIKPEIIESGIKTGESFKNKEQFESSVLKHFSGYLTQRADAFEMQLNQIQK